MALLQLITVSFSPTSQHTSTSRSSSLCWPSSTTVSLEANTADQTEVQKPVKESINLFIARVPLTLQTWTKESRFQIQKQSREKGTLSSQGTSVVISDLSVLQLYLYLAFTVHILYTLQEAESQKHQNITAQTKLLPNRDTGNPGACT